jgi:hypothetical protein
LSFALSQVPQERFKADHPGHRGPLIGLSESFVVNQSLTHLDNVNITVLDFPELPRLQLSAAFCLFCLHIIKTDTQESVLLRESGLQFCNGFVGVR